MSMPDPTEPMPVSRPEPSSEPSTFVGATLSPAPSYPDCPPFEPPGHDLWPRVPGYEIIDELGHGGMGVVYLARQAELNRLVALKMILQGDFAVELERGRFRVEAEAIARLSHPNIVQVFQAGEHHDRPFLSLEYCRGGTLSSRLGGMPVAAAEAARLVEALSRGVACAHAAGIVHRDLKPANVLLSEPRPSGSGEPQPLPDGRGSDGGRAWGGVPKVTDFGLALRLGADVRRTRDGLIMGSPPYMSPEQARGGLDVGPACDIYALGAVLYECLTGRPPFLGATPMDTLTQVLNEEPVPPKRLQPAVPRDLETITLKCLRKDPARRYATAADLGDDLLRYLADEPIRARPISLPERAWKWARRHPGVAGMSAACALVLAASFALVSWKWREAVVERDAKRAALARAELSLYFKDVAMADREWLDGNLDRAEDVLDDCPDALRGWEWGYLRRCLRGGLLTLAGHADKVSAVAVAPGGDRLASGSHDGTVRLWDLATGKLVRTVEVADSKVHTVAFSPDGQRLAVARNDGSAHVLALADGRRVARLAGHAGPVRDVAFHPDGKRLATCGDDHTLRVWDVAAEKVAFQPDPRANRLTRVAFSPDGTRLASAGHDNLLVVHDVATELELFRQGGHRDGIMGLAFSPDGGLVATAAGDGTARVWDAAGKGLRVLRGHKGYVDAVAFSPDGTRIVTAGQDRSIRQWDAATGLPGLQIDGHKAGILAAVFTQDGRRVVTGSEDKTIKVWDAVHEPTAVTLIDSAGDVLDVAVAPDGRACATFADGAARVFDLAGGREPRTFRAADAALGRVRFSPDAARLALTGDDRAVRVWGAPDQPPLLKLEGHDGLLTALAYRPDGREIASAGHDEHVRICDARSGKATRSWRAHGDVVRAVAYSRDGRRLVTAGEDKKLKLWNLVNGKAIATVTLDAIPADVAFSPDGRRLAAGTVEGGVLLFAADLSGEPTSLRGHAGAVNRLAFHPDGGRLASAGADRLIKLWAVATGQEVLTLRGHRGAVTCLAFSPGGEWLISGGEDQALKVWAGGPAEE